MPSQKYLLNLILSSAVCVLLFVEQAASQSSTYWKRYRAEVSFGAGPSNFLGELGGSDGVGSYYFKDLNFLATRFAISAGYRYKVFQYAALRANLSYGTLFGDDRLSQNFYRHYRGLNFRTNIFEASGTVELSIYKEQIGHRYRLRGPIGRKALQLYTYLFFGGGLFYFNPQGYYRGEWHNLRKLGTEGQGLVPTRPIYSNVQFVIPIGIGFKYTIDRKWGIGVEYGFRSTFTDYIDDVSQTYFDNQIISENHPGSAAELADRGDGSHPEITAANQQRGNPNITDAYMFAIISVNYKFDTKRFKARSHYYKDINPLF